MRSHTRLPSSSLSTFLQGFFAGLICLGAFYYFLLFTVTRDPLHPFSQFTRYQPWMSFLLLGFGIQLGLFFLLRKGIMFSLEDKKDARLAAGTGGTISGVAMVACCAHHVVDLLPILGLSAAALFLSDYQQEFLIIGVLTNLLGIFLMGWFIFGKPKPADISKYLSLKLRSLV